MSYERINTIDGIQLDNGVTLPNFTTISSDIQCRKYSNGQYVIIARDNCDASLYDLESLSHGLYGNFISNHSKVASVLSAAFDTPEDYGLGFETVLAKAGELDPKNVDDEWEYKVLDETPLDKDGNERDKDDVDGDEFFTLYKEYPNHMCFSYSVYDHGGVCLGGGCMWDTSRNAIVWYPTIAVARRIRWIADKLAQESSNASEDRIEALNKQFSSLSVTPDIDITLEVDDVHKKLEGTVAEYMLEADVKMYNCYLTDEIYDYRYSILQPTTKEVTYKDTVTQEVKSHYENTVLAATNISDEYIYHCYGMESQFHKIDNTDIGMPAELTYEDVTKTINK